MQARTYRDIASFDRNIAVLREHFDMLIDHGEGAARARLSVNQGGENGTA